MMLRGTQFLVIILLKPHLLGKFVWNLCENLCLDFLHARLGYYSPRCLILM